MQGETPTLKDIDLDLHELIMPANLLSNESLSPDDEQQEEQVTPFQIDSWCPNCHKALRVCVLASAASLRRLEVLLVSDLSFVCPGCSRLIFRNGRIN